MTTAETCKVTETTIKINNETPWRICACGTQVYKNDLAYSQKWAAHVRTCPLATKRTLTKIKKRKKNIFNISNTTNFSLKTAKASNKNSTNSLSKKKTAYHSALLFKHYIPNFSSIVNNQTNKCNICEKNYFGADILSCIKCGQNVHWFYSDLPISIIINKELQSKWICKNCSTCEICQRDFKPNSIENDNNIIACAICAKIRAHINCVNMNNIGGYTQWICSDCCKCYHCGIFRNDLNYMNCLTNLCNQCNQQFIEREQCLFCKKTLDINIPMIRCKLCTASMHVCCVGFNDKIFDILQNDTCLGCIFTLHRQNGLPDRQTKKLYHKYLKKVICELDNKNIDKTTYNCHIWCCRKPKCNKVFQNESARRLHETYHTYYEETFTLTPTLQIY